MPHLLGSDTLMSTCISLLFLSSAFLFSQSLSQETRCGSEQISIFQGFEGYMEGIPQFSVQISNNCMSCNPWDIHVFCGWFASATLVNPNSFERISYNDCLVNGGIGVQYGQIVRFTYANSFMYPMRFKSAKWWCRP